MMLHITVIPFKILRGDKIFNLFNFFLPTPLPHFMFSTPHLHTFLFLASIMLLLRSNGIAPMLTIYIPLPAHLIMENFINPPHIFLPTPPPHFMFSGTPLSISQVSLADIFISGFHSAPLQTSNGTASMFTMYISLPIHLILFVLQI